MPAGIPEVLAALASVLSRHTQGWYLFGAQAVQVWGSPRMTADVDVTVRVAGAAGSARLVQEMEAAGFAGYSEVEIFSSENWWKRPADEVVATCIERHRSVV